MRDTNVWHKACPRWPTKTSLNISSDCPVDNLKFQAKIIQKVQPILGPQDITMAGINRRNSWFLWIWAGLWPSRGLLFLSMCLSITMILPKYDIKITEKFGQVKNVATTYFYPPAWKPVWGFCDSAFLRCVCAYVYVCVCSSLVRFWLFGSPLKSPITTKYGSKMQ